MARGHLVSALVLLATLLTGCPRPAPEGGATCNVCGSSCVDAQTDPQNCGACGHDCQGGGCVAGACQPVLLVTGTGESGFSSFGGLALDAERVYWTDTTYGVASLPLAGGTPSQLVAYSGSTTTYGAVAVSTDTAYMTPGSVVDTPKAGQMMTPQTLVTAQAACGVAVDGQAVYFTDNSAGTVGRVPFGSTTVAPLFVDTNGPCAIALDADSVYWANNVLGTVNKVAKAGGTMLSLASDQGDPTGIAVDAASVYWVTNVGGSVMSAPLGGGAAVPIATGENLPFSVAVDDTYVYWVLATHNGELRRRPIAGGPAETLGVACDAATCGSGTSDVAYLAVSPQSVYWTSAHNLVRIAR